MTRLEEQLILHEALRLKPYKDTLGLWTWMVGYNISGRGLDFVRHVTGKAFDGPIESLECTEEDALKVLRADIARLEKVAPAICPDYPKLDPIRQRVIMDLVFNMEFKLEGFKKFLAAIAARDWSKAVRELWTSRWAKQVGDGPGHKRDRADRLTQMLLTGQDYTA